MQQGFVNFEEKFKVLTEFGPMRWQQRLYNEYFALDSLPSAVSVPTGLGKTAVMAIWLIALADQMKSSEVTLPRRLVYVVDRRAVVDQATQFAEDLRTNLNTDDGRVLRDALGLSSGEELPISTLRGQFVDNRDWLADPSRPAIIVGTVDMIGSRLLFEGYGVSRKMRPYHAGLLGADSLVMLDEAHLVPPFEALLADIAENTKPDRAYSANDSALNKLVPKFQLLPLTATSRRKTNAPFALEDRDFRDGDTILDAETHKRLFAEKHLIFKEQAEKNLEDALVKQAWAMVQDTQEQDNGEDAETSLKPLRIIVYCDSRDVAEKAYKALEQKAKKHGVKERTELFVGARRVKERTDAEKQLKKLGFLAQRDEQTEPAFLVATSAGEVGVDLDADHLVCDLVAWERMVQRFGRVNRRGGEGRKAEIVVMLESEPKPKKAVQDALSKPEGQRSDKDLKAIEKHENLVETTQAKQTKLKAPFGAGLQEQLDGSFDVSPEALRQLNKRASGNEKLAQLILDASSPAPLRPALNRPLLDAWSMTSLREHAGRPEVAPWLRGWEENDDPQTTVVWRKYLPVRAEPEVKTKEIEDFFEAAPVHTSEKLETETFRVFKWLKARAKKIDAQVQSQACGIILTPDGKSVRTLSAKDLLGDSNDDKKRHKDIERDLKGKTLVMRANFGGLQHGLLVPNVKDGWLSAKKDEPQLPETADGDGPWADTDVVPPMIRFRIVEYGVKTDGEDNNETWRENQHFVLKRNGEGEATHWLSIQKWRDTSNNEDDRAEGRPQALSEHQSWAADRAREIGNRLGLPEEYIAMLAIAARLHDEGKQAPNWQNAFKAHRDKKDFNIKGPLAKTRGSIYQSVLGGYRHEFGSLPYAQKDTEFQQLSDEMQDLVLHLIAAHHGHARPLIVTKGCDGIPPSVLEKRAQEVALRFARLQKRWGPWGLAWWEALLRAADVQASRDNDDRESN